MRRPLLGLFLSFVSGIVFAREIGLPPAGSILAAVAVVSFFLAALRKDGSLKPERLWPLFFVLSFFLGALRCQWSDAANEEKARRALRESTGWDALLEARVEGPLERRKDRFRFLAADSMIVDSRGRVPLPGRILIEGRWDDSPRIEYGRWFRLQGRLRPVPGAPLPGGFDYSEYLAAQDVHARMWATRVTPIEPEPERLALVSGFLRFAFRFRQQVLEQFESMLPQSQAGLMGAILLGERTQLPPATLRDLTASGLMHLTAISGLHVTFMTGLLFLFLKGIGFRRRTAAVFMVPLLLFILAMIGFRLPTVRAVLMGWAVVLAFTLERDVDPLSSISAAGLAIVLFSPLQVFQAGFQMSFAAMGALVVLTPRWDRWVRDRGLPGRWLWTLLGASLAAQAGVAPIVASHFGIWTPVAILSNLAAIPLVWILLALGMGWMGTVLVGGLGGALLAPPISLLSEGLLRVVALSAKVPWGHFDAMPMGPVGIGAWYGILALLVWKPGQAASRKRWPIKRIHAVLILCALWLWSGLFAGAKGRLEITFPSLGQGDCILVEFPEGGCLLVDGGERFDTSQRAPELVRLLLRNGITRVDAIVNTHPQSDHIGCLPEVLDHFPVGVVYHCGASGQGEAVQAFEEALEREGCKVLTVRRGQSIEGFPGAKIEILCPNPDYLAYSELDVNYHSVVLRIEYGDFSCLLTGDIPAEVEQELVRLGLAEDCTVLKVPHHGSGLSSTPEFLDRLQPEVAVILVGRNTFGHPHPRVVESLKSIGATTLRTDLDGTVRVITDGKTFTCDTILGMNGE